jgi:cysteine synthase
LSLKGEVPSKITIQKIFLSVASVFKHNKSISVTKQEPLVAPGCIKAIVAISNIMSAPSKNNVATRPSDLVGNTPLLDLGKILKDRGVENGSKLYGKLESLGPCSSVKDRLGLAMIDDAEAKGLLTPGKSVIVEPTSGNTGIALAFLARERGYRCILTVS